MQVQRFLIALLLTTGLFSDAEASSMMHYSQTLPKQTHQWLVQAWSENLVQQTLDRSVDRHLGGQTMTLGLHYHYGLSDKWTLGLVQNLIYRNELMNFNDAGNTFSLNLAAQGRADAEVLAQYALFRGANRRWTAFSHLFLPTGDRTTGIPERYINGLKVQDGIPAGPGSDRATGWFGLAWSVQDEDLFGEVAGYWYYPGFINDTSGSTVLGQDYAGLHASGLFRANRRVSLGLSARIDYIFGYTLPGVEHSAYMVVDVKGVIEFDIMPGYVLRLDSGPKDTFHRIVYYDDGSTLQDLKRTRFRSMLTLIYTP